MLSSLLFLNYISDLPDSSILVMFFTFSDDTIIYFEANDKARLRETVEELGKVKVCVDSNKLALNIDQTIITLFRSPKQKVAAFVSAQILQENIKRNRYVKFSSDLVDEHFSWKHHMCKLHKNLSRATRTLLHAKALASLSKSSLRICFTIFFFS